MSFPTGQPLALLVLSTAALVSPGLARAAELTSLVEAKTGDVEVGYRGRFSFGTLRENEADQEVGAFNEQRHEIWLGGEYGIIPGIEAHLGFTIVPNERRVWGRARQISYDPDLERAVMADQPFIDGSLLTPTTGSGFGDLWFGASFTPFSEDFRRPSPVTVYLDLSVKAPTANSWHDVNDNGNRGPGSGGVDLALTAGFSRRLPTADPYIVFRYLATGPAREDLYDVQGDPVYTAATGNAAILNPADRFEVMAGAELFGGRGPTADGFRVDLRMGFAYVSWQTIASGRLLPNVLPATVGYIATEAEHAEVFGRFGGIVDANRVQVRFHVQLDYLFSHTLERVDERNYAFQTGPDHLRLDAGLTVSARIGRRARDRAADEL